MSYTNTKPAIQKWHNMLESRDMILLNELLADDVVFRSPVAYNPYEGKQVVFFILSNVIQIFENFTYHREFFTEDEQSVVLEFSANVGEKKLKGIDMIRFNEQGQIVDFEVMIRPKSGWKHWQLKWGNVWPALYLKPNYVYTAINKIKREKFLNFKMMMSDKELRWKMSVLHKFTEISQDLLDQVTGAELPKLYFNQQGKMSEIIKKLPQLQDKYRPTPWLSNTHAHLLYFDLIKKKSVKLDYDRIDQLTMQDGGVTAIAWYGYDLPKATPTIVIMHTITGTPDSMRELVKDLHEYTGWRIALCLRRGHAGLPMPVPLMSIFGSTSDLKEQLASIQNTFPQSDLYAVGSSAGTGLLVRYLGEQGLDTPFKAAFCHVPWL